MYEKLVRYFVLPMAVFLLIGTAMAQDIQFNISPSGQVMSGTQLVLHCHSGSEGTTHYEIIGTTQSSAGFNEFAGPDNVAYLETQQWGDGTLVITCAVRHPNQTWVNAERVTKYVQVMPALIPQPGQPVQLTSGIYFDGYCKTIGFDYFSGNSKDAFSGVCARGKWGIDETTLDMAAVCNWATQGTLKYPGLANPEDLYNWSCNSQPTSVATISNPGTVACPGAPVSFMVGMSRGRSTTKGKPLNVRRSPGGTRFDSLENGETFEIIGEPDCSVPKAVFWKIRNARIAEGWVMEGDFQDHYIQAWGQQP